MEVLFMEILTIKEAGELWGISKRRIATLCKQGRIPGAVKAAGVWILPPDSKKPADARIKSGKYVNWRSNMDMSSSDYKSNLKNIKGTFAVEGVDISDDSISNLKRLATGEASCSEIIEELKQKYMQRV